jgi:hypothetical protein
MDNPVSSGQTPQTSLQILDNPHSPDVFATEAAGFSLIGGNIGVTFVTTKVDHSSSPPELTGVVIGRMVMPVEGAQRLVLGLSDFLRQRGLDPERLRG